MLLSLEKLDSLHSIEVLFPVYISEVLLEHFQYHGKNIPILWNWAKLWKLDFPSFSDNFYRNAARLHIANSNLHPYTFL